MVLTKPCLPQVVSSEGLQLLTDTGQTTRRERRQNYLFVMIGLEKSPGGCWCCCWRGCPSRRASQERSNSSRALCSHWDAGVWLSKSKAEINPFRSVLGLRKPSLPSLAAVHWAVMLLSFRSKQSFYQISSAFRPHRCHLHCSTRAGYGSLTFGKKNQ